MADVQAENGYTAIANETLDRIAKVKLSPMQYRLIFVIWRYTYGFKRKEHSLSLSFLAKAISCDKRQIQRELRDLENRKIIIQKITNGVDRVISFQKNYELWIGETTIGEVTIGEVTNDGETTNATIGEVTNPTIGEVTNQEINTLNKTLNKIYRLVRKPKVKIPYKEIVDYLNQKAKTSYKHTSKATQDLINARFNENFTLSDFKTVIDKKVDEWTGTEWEKFIRPATLFSNKFEGYKNQKIIKAKGVENKFVGNLANVDLSQFYDNLNGDKGA